MIQDIAPHTYHNEYRPVAPDGSSFVLAYVSFQFAEMGKRYRIVCIIFMKETPPLHFPNTSPILNTV